MEFVLKVKDLKQNLATSGSKPRQILDGISFNIPKGSLTGFIGVNGAGKTTTIKSILRFIHASSGQADFFGESGLTLSGRQKLGFMPERPYFYDFLTGYEFLELHWKLRGLAPDDTFKSRCDEVLRAVDLERGKQLRLRQFSKGMLQRIGIAQAIIHNPEFLIFDEPMSGLDPDGRILVKNIIRKLHSQGVTIFFSSHLLQDMEELCDRVVIIDQGRIIFEGDPEAVKGAANEEYSIVWSDAPETATTTVHCAKVLLQATIDQLRRENKFILQVVPRKISLEEAFMTLRKNRE
jgi:ABC-2 type transport system ATP-binding protein